MFESKLAARTLYLQVRDAFMRRIQSGEWKPGRPIPSEFELAQLIKVSPGTVRKALQTMEQDRIVIRRQGRGTFVNDISSDEFPERFTNLRASGGTPVEGRFGKRPRIWRSPASKLEAERLRIAKGSEALHIRGLKFDEGKPLLRVCSVMPSSLFPKLPADLTKLTIAALAQINGVLLGKCSECVTMRCADASDARALAVERNTPLLHLDRVVFTLDGEPVEWRTALCRLDMDRFYQAPCV
jgi:GntR family transcriptional regulator